MKPKIAKWMYLAEAISTPGLLNIAFLAYHWGYSGVFWVTAVVLIFEVIGFSYKINKFEKENWGFGI